MFDNRVLNQGKQGFHTLGNVGPTQVLTKMTNPHLTKRRATEDLVTIRQPFYTITKPKSWTIFELEDNKSYH